MVGGTGRWAEARRCSNGLYFTLRSGGFWSYVDQPFHRPTGYRNSRATKANSIPDEANTVGITAHLFSPLEATIIDIPGSTLNSHLQKGHLPEQFGYDNQQRLTHQQEEWLTRWIIDEDRKGIASDAFGIENPLSISSICIEDIDFFNI